MRRWRRFISIFAVAVLTLSSTFGSVAYAVPKDYKSVSASYPAYNTGSDKNTIESDEAENTVNNKENIAAETTDSNNDEKESIETEFIKKPEEETEWTVYIYMCGTTLETDDEFATSNIKDLLKAEYCEDARFILQTGGTKEWHTDWIDEDKLQRFMIQGSNKKLVWEDELKSMAYPDTLSDFIKWGKEYYPSKRSMLIIWDHGLAFNGAVSDENYDGEVMSLRDYEKAFADSDVHFDIIDFDCCQMADLDVCMNLSPYADYLLVSEEAVAGCGQDYRALGDYLALNSCCSGKTLGRTVCGAYVDNLHRQNITDSNGISLIDTSKLPQVREAFLGMIEAMVEKMSDTEVFSDMLRSAYASKNYYYEYEKDLVSFAKAVAPYLGEDVCGKIEDAVRKAVIAKAQTGESTYNNGISFYWAPSGRERVNYYLYATDMNDYLAFINAIIWEYNMPSRVYENTERLDQLDYDTYALNYEMQDDKGVFDKVKITGGKAALNTMYYNIYGTYNDRQIEISKLGNISYDKSGTVFKTAFDGKIAALDGEPLVLNVISETEDYILYNAPIYTEADGETVPRNLRIAYIPDESDADSKFIGSVTDEEHGSFEIIGFAKELETSAGNLVTKDSIEIDADTVIYPAYPTADGNTLIKGSPIVYDENSSIDVKLLDDGTYYLNYEIGSSLGESVITEKEEFQIKDGKITAPEAPENDEENTNDESSNDDNSEEIMLGDHEVGSYHINITSYKKYHGKEFVDRYVPSDKTDRSVMSAEQDKKTPAKVTLIAFMIGIDHETSYGLYTKEIEDFLQAEDSDDVNVVLQTGGSLGWKGDCFDPDSIQRFELHHDTLVEVSREPLYNMSTEKSLEDYIKWCAANYPAEHYVIEFFDHGGAWTGMCVDEKYGSILSLDDISTAMKNSGLHFDLTYFNMCLMSTIEVAAAVQPYSDYMLASEEEEYAVPYKEGDMVNYIIRHADDFDAAELAKHKSETYLSTIEEYGLGNMYQTISVIDLSKIPALVDAVDQMGREMSEIAKDPAKLTKLIRGIDNSRKFGYAFMRDIVDMVRHADGLSKETRNAVINAVSDAVYYMASSKDYLRTGGISIYFDISSGLKDYSCACPAKDYLAFLDCANISYHVLPDAMSDDRKQESVSPLDFKINNSVEVTDDTKVSLITQNSPEIINAVSYRVMEYDEEQDKYYYLYYGTDIDFDTGEGKFTENFDGRTTALGDKYCFMLKYCVMDDKILFNIPVKLDGTKLLNLRVAYTAPESRDDEKAVSKSESGYASATASEIFKQSECGFFDDRIDFDNGTFEIIGLFNQNDYMNGYADAANYILKKGMTFTLQIPEVDADGYLLGYVDGEELTWDNDMNISLKGLPDGDYALRFVTTNGILKSTVSDTAELNIRNGRIKTVELAD